MKYLSVLVLLINTYYCPAQEKEPVAVLDLKGRGVDQNTAQILSDELRTELFRSGHYNVLNREDMKAILGEHAFQQSGLCDDAKCMAQIGGALGVIYMVTGSIGKLGHMYSITLKLIDIEKIENVKIVDEKYKGLEEGLFTAVRNAGRKLLGMTEMVAYTLNPVEEYKKYRKSHVLATAYAAIPGGAHLFYHQQYVRGGLYLGCFITGIVLTVTYAFEDTGREWLGLGLLMAGMYGSFIDSNVVTYLHNIRLKKKLGLALMLPVDNKPIRLSLEYSY